MPSGGFIAVRRGLLEHLRRGKLTELEALTFIIILGLANPHTGIWWGSAKSLWGEYPFYGNERRARRALEGLASKWYIKRLSTPGKHSNYPILIDKYEVKVGAKVGLRLNARKSRNERSLCYEKNGARLGEGELGVIHGGEEVVKVGVFGGGQTDQKAASTPPLLKKEKETEKEKKKEHAQASPSLIPNAYVLEWFNSFWEAYPRKVGKPSALKAWKKISFVGTELLAGLERWKQTDQWQTETLIPHPTTFLNDRRWEDDPPARERGKDASVGRGPQPTTFRPLPVAVQKQLAEKDRLGQIRRLHEILKGESYTPEIRRQCREQLEKLRAKPPVNP